MPRYNVNFSMPVHFNVEVDADDAESAKDKAMEFAYLTSYVGNGATSGKLIGTSEERVHLEPGEEVLDGYGFEITADKLE